jgi:hypothetical protein
VIAYKFLDGEGRAVFSGFRWTDGPPGRWIETGAVVPCREGIHGCRAADLAWWVNEELWEIELDGDVVEAPRKVAARRGRILRRLDGWAGGAAPEFAEAVTFRARDSALAVSGSRPELAALADCPRVDEIRPAAQAALGGLEDGSVAHVAVGLVADAAFFADQHICHAPFISACAAGHAAAARTGSRADWRAGFEGERAWQSAWITRRLELPAG